MPTNKDPDVLDMVYGLAMAAATPEARGRLTRQYKVKKREKKQLALPFVGNIGDTECECCGYLFPRSSLRFIEEYGLYIWVCPDCIGEYAL